MQTATFTLKRPLSGKTLKTWRMAHKLSAHDLALELGVSRSYVKSIEGGSLEASQKIIKRFDALKLRMGEESASAPETKLVTLISHYEMPATIEILAKPRRCKGCRKWFVPVTPNQRMHTTENCRRAAKSVRTPKKDGRRRRKGRAK